VRTTGGTNVLLLSLSQTDSYYRASYQNSIKPSNIVAFLGIGLTHITIFIIIFILVFPVIEQILRRFAFDSEERVFFLICWFDMCVCFCEITLF
jgi:hypothetical protein